MTWPGSGEVAPRDQFNAMVRRVTSPLLAHFGHAAISELSQLSGVKRKLDFESAKGSFWLIVLKNSPVEAEGLR
jgi:hypothetical protein